MKVISCLGRKGGSGKTMIAHLLAHGLTKGYGIFVNLVMTDVRDGRPMEINPNRQYFISSIRNKSPEDDAAELQRLFETTEQMDNSVLIADGGANRTALDAVLALKSDMILIPMGFSVEDISVAETDFWRLMNEQQKTKPEGDISIIRNRWPGTGRKREALVEKDWVKPFLQRANHTGMLFPDFVPDMPSLLDMSNADNPKTTPLIDAVSVRFAEVVAMKIGIKLPERRKLTPYGFGIEQPTQAGENPDKQPGQSKDEKAA